MNIKRLFVTSIEVSRDIILTTSLVNTVFVNTNDFLAPLNSAETVSYTHLTLPTNREV